MYLLCLGFCFLNVLIGVYAPGGGVPPNLLWPLDSYTYGIEVKLSPSKPVSPVYCGLYFNGVKPSGYPFDAVYLDGSSYIDVPVSYAITSEADYSFTGMFKLSSSNGTFFHFRSNDNTQTFVEIKLWFSGNNISMSRTLSAGEELSSFEHSLPVSWFQISFGVDRSNGRMIVMIDSNEVFKSEDVFMHLIDISLPGKLRIGATFDSTQSNLVGHVTCVAFFEDKPKAEHDVIDGMCKAPSWSTNKPNCHTHATEKSRNTTTGMFVKPEAIYSSILNLLSTSQRGTEISCAMGCYLDNWCWYYKVHIENGQSLCQMYTSAINYSNTPEADDENIYQWFE